MTLSGRIATFFPMVHVFLIACTIIGFLLHPGITTLLTMLAVTYILPPALFGIYSLRYPPKPGKWVLNHPVRCEWWIAHQLQISYATIPTLESLLRLVPGAYSSWLRLWGGKIGKNIYWTPHVEIIDRHMINIEDEVVFGHRVVCCSHVINKKPNEDLVLIQQPVNIGKGALIGADARLGPGVVIAEKTKVPYNAEYIFKKIA